jgi:hypothetical protein
VSGDEALERFHFLASIWDPRRQLRQTPLDCSTHRFVVCGDRMLVQSQFSTKTKKTVIAFLRNCCGFTPPGCSPLGVVLLRVDVAHEFPNEAKRPIHAKLAGKSVGGDKCAPG